MSHKLVLLLCLALAPACSSYPEVSKKKCGKIVGHARKLLGDKGGTSQELMASCKAASGSERGCALSAKTGADLLRCSM